MQKKLFWVGLAVAAIWLGVLFISLFTPDFVSGSQQEHLKIVAGVAWIFGAVATGSVLKMMLQRRPDSEKQTQILAGIAGIVAVIWLAVALVSIFVPPMVTGTDPTVLPFAAIFALIAGTIVTSLIGSFVERFQPAAINKAAATGIKCNSCGQDVPYNAKFCSHCGAALPAPLETAFCSKCGAKTPAGNDFCAHCGSRLAMV